MPKVRPRLAAYIKKRWPIWLKRALDECAVSRAMLAQRLRTTSSASSEPHSAITDWLLGRRAPVAEMAFIVGQKLEGVGGLISLHGAGHYDSALAVVLALLRKGQSDEVRRYAARFVSLVWVLHEDLDVSFDVPIPPYMRDADLNLITTGDATVEGDPPLEALENAWNDRKKLDATSRAVVTLASSASENESADAIYKGALVAWAALFELIAVRATSDKALADIWKRNQYGFESYMSIVHERMREDSYPTPKLKTQTTSGIKIIQKVEQ